MGKTEDDDPLAPLQKTIDALKQIRCALTPFLKVLKDDVKRSSQPNDIGRDGKSSGKKRNKPDSDTTPKLDAHRRAEAETAVALTIGTLRYMGARLRGLDQGRKKGDPLRMELDKIRAKLVELKKIEAAAKEPKESKFSESSPSEKEDTDSGDTNPNTKRRKVLDIKASERMITAALNS